MKKVLALVLCLAMVLSLAACGGSEEEQKPADNGGAAATEAPATTDAPVAAEAPEPTEEVSPYPIIKDADGNIPDLGGIEVIWRDWWSPEEPAAPTNEYEEARDEYRAWAMETYNFTLKQKAIGDWGTNPQDFVDYATTGGDEYYIFTQRPDSAIVNALYQGLCFDLASLDCLDFSEEKFQKTGVYELYTVGDGVYGMYAGDSEPRTGCFFNKRVLADAGIDANYIYELQDAGEWNWENCEKIMATVQRDIDNDGVIDVYGMTNNTSNFYKRAAFSNNGAFVKKENGQFRYALNDADTLSGLNWAQDMVTKYDLVTVAAPADAQWDYYKTAFQNGDAVFSFDDAYMVQSGEFKDMEDIGFACFPKGPDAADYTDVECNNVCVIPSCYDAEKAWKIAFAWNVFTDPVPGFEDYVGWKSGYYSAFCDTESVDKSCAIMVKNVQHAYHSVIPDLKEGEEFTWNLGAWNTIAAAEEAARGVWTAYVENANNLANK